MKSYFLIKTNLSHDIFGWARAETGAVRGTILGLVVWWGWSRIVVNKLQCNNLNGIKSSRRKEASSIPLRLVRAYLSLYQELQLCCRRAWESNPASLWHKSRQSQQSYEGGHIDWFALFWSECCKNMQLHHLRESQPLGNWEASECENGV